MRWSLSSLVCASLAAAGGSSFQDTSPFLFFSTSEILASPPKISHAEALTATLKHELAKCPTDLYVLAHQPGVVADDYSEGPASRSSVSSHGTPASFSTMQQYFSGEDKRIRSAFTVPQVVGRISQGDLKDFLYEQCGAVSMHLDARVGISELVDEVRPRVVTLSMSGLPSGQGRSTAAHVNEMYLSSMLDALPTSNFTVIYTTTPPMEAAQQEQEDEAMQYEMDHSDAFVHLELRRDVNGDVIRRANKNSTVDPNAPLFEKYQYLTPGLFMGFSVGLILLSIIYVAISAIAGMEVSYAAFDKENGPQAQRKQQQ